MPHFVIIGIQHPLDAYINTTYFIKKKKKKVAVLVAEEMDGAWMILKRGVAPEPSFDYGGSAL